MPKPTATPDPENSPRIHRDKTRRGQFGPGNPGTPFQPGNQGRPRGARDKAATKLARLFQGEAERIGRRAIELAEEGRVGCVKLVLDRAFAEPRAERTLPNLQLPVLKTGADALAAMGLVAAALADGTITTDMARDLSVTVDAFRKMYELANLESRIVALEARVRNQGRASWRTASFAGSDGVGT